MARSKIGIPGRADRIICSLCHGPITLIQKEWTHAADRLSYFHKAVPAPSDATCVTLNFSSKGELAKSVCEDFVSTARKRLSWVGAYAIAPNAEEATAHLMISVLNDEVEAAHQLGVTNGLFFGKTPRAVVVNPRGEPEGEGGENNMAGKSKKQVQKKKATGTTKQRSKEEYRADPNYFECKTCSHFVLKDKKERHFEKHPACRSQKPPEKKRAAKATKKAAKKVAKKAAKKSKTAAATSETKEV